MTRAAGTIGTVVVWAAAAAAAGTVALGAGLALGALLARILL